MLHPRVAIHRHLLEGAAMVEVSPLEYRVQYKSETWVAWVHLDTAVYGTDDCGLEYYAQKDGVLVHTDATPDDFLPSASPAVVMWQSSCCSAFDLACMLSTYTLSGEAKAATVQLGFIHNSHHVEISVGEGTNVKSIGRRWLPQQYTGTSQEVEVQYALMSCYIRCMNALMRNRQIDKRTPITVHKLCTQGQVITATVRLVVGDDIFIGEGCTHPPVIVGLNK